MKKYIINKGKEINTFKGGILLFISLILFFTSCEEEGRYNPKLDDSTPPGKVENVTYRPLYGGARFAFDVPPDEDVILVEAVYSNTNNESFSFTASYFADSLDVYGFQDTINYQVTLYAVDRAGNKSEPVEVTVKPLESVLTRVKRTIKVKSGFSSFFIEWENELEQSINVFIDFSFSTDGTKSEFTSVFSSNLQEERRFINDLDLSAEELINVKVRIEDIYGNSSIADTTWNIAVLQDIQIPKDNWALPATNDSIVGIPMCYGNGAEGRSRYVIDGIIDTRDNLNFLHTLGVGRTGIDGDGNIPWNVIIDLGKEYELSRIVTHQRHSSGTYSGVSRGQYYREENVGSYNMYYLDEDINEWVLISNNKILVPEGLTELEYLKLGQAGDWAYMYPDNPEYTKPARWFRYECIAGFNGSAPNCLSEITLFAKNN